MVKFASESFLSKVSRLLRSTAGLTGLLSATACTFAMTAEAAPNSPAGLWFTKDNESVIKVQPCMTTPDAFCGTIVWLKQPKDKDGSPKVDTLNPDPVKRKQTIIGLEILIDMTVEEDHWSGKAYNPEDGKFYSITFKVKGEAAPNDKADLRGCVLGFLCQTETFTRASAIPGADTKKHKATKKEPAEGTKTEPASQ